MAAENLARIGLLTIDFFSGLPGVYPLPGSGVDAVSELIVDSGPGSGFSRSVSGLRKQLSRGERGGGGQA
jgi:hypothetical protein